MRKRSQQLLSRLFHRFQKTISWSVPEVKPSRNSAQEIYGTILRWGLTPPPGLVPTGQSYLGLEVSVNCFSPTGEPYQATVPVLALGPQATALRQGYKPGGKVAFSGYPKNGIVHMDELFSRA